MGKHFNVFGVAVMIGWLGGTTKLMAEVPPFQTWLWVDKSRHELHQVQGGKDGQPPRIEKTFSVILGKVAGDKEQENDLKTPEGIYFLKNLQKPLTRAAQLKLGVLSIGLNFPNPFDRWMQRTGFGILIHGTSDRERLDKKNDTEGCVVLHDSDLLQLAQNIQIGKTPVFIFSTLTPDWQVPKGPQVDSLAAFFQSWVKAWEGQELAKYLAHYHPSFTSQGKNLEQWSRHKGRLNERYGRIEVRPREVLFLHHPKYSVVIFRQHYRSYLRDTPAQVGHTSQGWKTLYAVHRSQDDLRASTSQDALEKDWHWISEHFIDHL